MCFIVSFISLDLSNGNLSDLLKIPRYQMSYLISVGSQWNLIQFIEQSWVLQHWGENIKILMCWVELSFTHFLKVRWVEWWWYYLLLGFFFLLQVHTRFKEQNWGKFLYNYGMSPKNWIFMIQTEEEVWIKILRRNNNAIMQNKWSIAQ